MRVRSVLLLAVLLLIAIFVAVNWTVFVVPARLSLLVTTVEAPLGLVMLALCGGLAGLFLLYAMSLQSTHFAHSRRASRELERQRELATNAETSRIAELRTAMEARFDQLGEAAASARAEQADLVRHQTDEIRLEFERALNGVAAQIAELDDRVHGRSRVG